MPELPEVETVVTQLRPHVLHKKIQQVEILRERQWRNISPKDAISTLTQNTFISISRRAKFIIFELANSYRLLIHLRMSGKLMWLESTEPFNQYSRTIFNFEDGSSMQFNDTRALGTLEIVPPEENPECLQKLGIEPFGVDYRFEEIQILLNNSRLEIKDFLMDQTKIVGIGNIYANEILFRCHIHPRRKANSLNVPELKLLYKTIPEVLHAAVQNMGTTLGNKPSDYRTAYNIVGDYQNFLKVYGREGESCIQCGQSIMRIVQKGRSSFVCETCQQ